MVMVVSEDEVQGAPGQVIAVVMVMKVRCS